MFCEALLMHNIENIGYATTNIDESFILQHTDGKTNTTILTCSIPLLSKLARRLDKCFARKIIIALENLAYVIRILSRLPQDKVDVYVILHLWDYEIPFLNLILRVFRPTIIMWFWRFTPLVWAIGKVQILYFCLSLPLKPAPCIFNLNQPRSWTGILPLQDPEASPKQSCQFQRIHCRRQTISQTRQRHFCKESPI